MLRDLLTHPPATHFQRPEKEDSRPDFLEASVRALLGGGRRLLSPVLVRPDRILPHVEANERHFGALPDSAIPAEAIQLGIDLRRHRFRIDVVGRSFALIREVASRTLGKRHFDVQLMGGWVMLNGMIAEMETGEGKTLTATLAAGTAALAGIPVHVLTVNDYLAGRDAGEMGPIYAALGLSVGCVLHDVPVERRRGIYQSHVTYCTNKEIVFDYLRDKLTIGNFDGTPIRLQTESLYAKDARENRLLLRGLHYAIVDEADSLLIDESRTPLIIASPVVDGEEEHFMHAVIRFAATLKEREDFTVDLESRQIRMSDQGNRLIDELALPAETRWTSTIRKHEMVRRALSALHVFHRDKDYLVRDGKVQIIDPYTGRVMADRSWEQGLQQLIEIKEGCEITRQQETAARISYQKFFRRYLHLSGMTGTAREVRSELWDVYGLHTVRIRTHRPLLRVRHPAPLFPGKREKERYLLERIREIHAIGRPLLIGTGSVAASEDISCLLREEGIPHLVLNAKNDSEEAAIVARAGNLHCVTITTNMAGRGTDIKLGPGVCELGGLHVMVTDLHDAARIDRQLAGRSARQGDPGSFEMILSLEDAIMQGGTGGIRGWIARRLLRGAPWLWNYAARSALLHAQKRTEALHARMRRDLFKQDVQRRKQMTFVRREE